MGLNDIFKKLKSMNSEKNASVTSKFLTVIFIGMISFIPFYFIWSNIQKAMGEQPTISVVMTGVVVSIALLLIFLIWKTRPKKDK